MDDLSQRLTDCFLAVFPDIERREVCQANSRTVSAWDSVAGVTLLAVIEEEFGIAIEVQDLSVLTSYEGYLDYLQNEYSPDSSLSLGIP